MKKRHMMLTISIAAAMAMTMVVPVHAEETCLFSSDFETGVEIWSPMGSAVLSQDPANGHDGGCLHITGRTQNWNGAQVDLTALVQSGHEYRISSWGSQAQNPLDSITLSAKFTDQAGEATYANLTTADVSNGEWVELSGTLSVPDGTVEVIVYYEAQNPALEFSVDMFRLMGDTPAVGTAVTTTAAKGEDIFAFDFETPDATDGWSGRNTEKIMQISEVSNTGNGCLYVSERTDCWNGLQVSVNQLVRRDEPYAYSAYVMYNGEEYGDSHKFLLQLQFDMNGERKYETIAASVANKGEWTEVAGTYVLAPGAENAFLYMQTDNVEESTADDLMSFYLDTVSGASEAYDGASLFAANRNEGQSSSGERQLVIRLLIAIGVLLVIGGFTLFRYLRKRNAALLYADTDVMTRTRNRNAFEHRVQDLMKNHPRQWQELYVATCDVNFLKYLNDHYGHEVGDEAIVRCADLLLAAIGNNGLVYRTGGDEFVTLTKANPENMINNALERATIQEGRYPFAIAVGYAHYDPDRDKNFSDVIKRSDQNMYANKQLLKSRNEDFARKEE